MNNEKDMLNEEIRRISDEKVIELYQNLLQREPNKEEMNAFHFGFLTGAMMSKYKAKNNN